MLAEATTTQQQQQRARAFATAHRHCTNPVLQNTVVMSIAISAALAALNLGVKAVDGMSDFSVWLQKNKEQDAGRLYDKARELMNTRTVLTAVPVVAPSQTQNADPVKSPNVQSLVDLFIGKDEKNLHHATSVVYVLYDKKGNGKSHAGRAILQNFHHFTESGRDVKGIMVTGDSLQENIPDALCKKLGATSIEGWLHILLLAMNTTIGKDYPSILILDSVNSLGLDNCNVKFVQALYECMDMQRNIRVVVLTQDRAVAKALLDANGGARILPLPGSFNGQPDNPDWKETPWSMDQLVELVHYRTGNKYTDDHIRTFVEPDMTPLDVVKILNSLEQEESIQGEQLDSLQKAENRKRKLSRCRGRGPKNTCEIIA